MTWVRPNLVGGVCFIEWTANSRFRHPVRRGRWRDTPAPEVVRES
ncbi:MAG: hypothetical protein ACLQPH_16725 [Acidimicrobiales bacterium]